MSRSTKLFIFIYLFNFFGGEKKVNPELKSLSVDQLKREETKR